MAKTKAKKKASTAADRYATQVGAETTLKFGPEESSLQAALRDAEQGYGSEVAAARGTRRAIEQAAKTAKPKFAKDSATAGQTVKDVKATLAQDLAKLPAAGPLAGASSRDAAGTERRLAEALAANQSETDARARDAAAGEGYAVSNARNRLGENKEKIAQRQQDMAQEKGAFAQARAGELVEAGRDRSVTRRGQDKTSDTAAANRRTQNSNADADRSSREKIAADKVAADKAKAKAKGRATPEKTEKVKTALSRAVEQAKYLKDSEKVDRSRAAGALVNGRESVTTKNAPRDVKLPDGTTIKAGEELPTPIVTRGIKQTEQLYASVALDLAYDGHLSTANMKKLQKLGLSVRDLGLKTEGRSGTKTAREKARNGSPNPVRPKPLPSGAAALGRGGGILPQVTR